MTARRPSKPWRVTVTSETVHTDVAEAHTAARTALDADGTAAVACIEEWEGGRWRWFETMTKEDMA